MIRLAIRCRAEDGELALAQLLDLAPTGIEEVHDGEIVEYAIYGPPGEIPTLPDLQAVVGESLVEVTTTEVADDWRERWKDFHGAVRIESASGASERSVFLRPTWDDSTPSAGATEIVLDPGQAFGTGSHPTTRLCLAHLIDLAPSDGFVDLGCGSGVLAIAAEKIGWSGVRAYDFDRLAVEATLANAEFNDVTLQAERVDLRSEMPQLAATVFANLMRPLLLEIAAGWPETNQENPRVKDLVLSGLLDQEAAEIAAAFAERGFVEVGRNSEGGWTGLRLTTSLPA